MKKIKFSAIEQNEAFKVLLGKGRIGEGMTTHLSDKPAFLMVESGEILFKLNKQERLIQSSGTCSIPANQLHSFEVLEECLVTLILDADAKIKFVKDE